jgi:uncharacterized HhH-GPD family protein
VTTFRITGEPEADAVLDEYPLALVIGMQLDQQYGIEHAFRGGYKILSRFGSLDTADIAAADPDKFKALCTTPPAIHRFPGAKAAQVQALARIVEDTYGGDVTRLWSEAATGAELLRRIKALPGYGEQTAKILVALLGKQMGVRPEGWEAAAGVYAEEGSYRSVADVVDQASLQKVRAFKQEQKAAAKAGR